MMIESRKSKHYLPFLQDIVIGYNHSPHNSTKFSPNQAWDDKKTHVFIRDNLQKYYSKFIKRQPRFKIGETVTIRVFKTLFSRGFQRQTTNELFKVIAITTNLPIPMYTLQSTINDKDIIRGKFYEHEIVRKKRSYQ